MKPLFFLSALIFIVSCTGKTEKEISALFTKMPASHTNIDFINALEISPKFDVFRYRNYYNGGGVSIGDINNDGLADIYLTSNMGENKLYLNKGNFQFEDITNKAGVAGTAIWSTGVSMADVNGDGWLDIYVCNSGDILGGRRENELFINNGNLTFTEKATEFGLDDKGFSTHAVFFDFDQDEDLDCYILNNSFRPVSSLGYENIRNERDSTGGDKLLKNVDGVFVDVSDEAGIYGSVIGFGLGVTITDVNQDGWMDIYVSNDFFERDYLYINKKDGTFSEELPDRMGHISNFSMGTDAADLNNDGYPEIFVTDMLPETETRMKTMVNFESYDVNKIRMDNDYYHQYMRNTLQLNRGDGTFAEVGQYAGVAATDWSWGALIADFDNDRNKDIFVTNGIYKDLIDQDFIAYLANEDNLIAAMRAQTVDFQKLVDKMPSQKLSNYMFQRKAKGLSYKNVSAEWGLDEPSFSNGAAYGDLDNDGDLDLVVNNVNQELFVYRNESDNILKKNYLKISFKGPGKNTFGIGARVFAYAKGDLVMHENVPTKGFQSSMNYTSILGLDTIIQVDSLIIKWGYGKCQTLYNVKVNQHLILNIEDAKPDLPLEAARQSIKTFSPYKGQLNPIYHHKEDNFVDFDREGLMYHMLSKEGPALAVGDVNGDGLDDFYVGGATGAAGALYVQNLKGNFNKINQADFEEDVSSEDVDALFFDANNDGLPDLYVVSGGNAFPENSPGYQDRLYLNKGNKNGNPVFEKSSGAIPSNFTMGACVSAADFDKDGDLDLFVGARGIPGNYGLPASSYFLLNNGRGQFEDATARVAPQLSKLGMVTDAVWVDYDNDEDMDLVVVGDWMPMILFKNNGSNLERLSNVPGLTQTDGFWKSIEVADVNDDGNVDFILGNLGLNSRYKASKEHPLTMYVNDFDKNGLHESVFAQYEGDKLHPIALRHDMIRQMPSLKKKYIYYKNYAGQTIQDVFTPDQLSNAIVKKIHCLESAIVINNGDGSYELKPLPEEVQFAPILSIAQVRTNSSPLLIMGGNFSGVKPEEGRYDANIGTVIEFSPGRPAIINDSKSGLRINGEVRKILSARSIKNKNLLIIAKNNDQLEIYEYK